MITQLKPSRIHLWAFVFLFGLNAQSQQRHRLKKTQTQSKSSMPTNSTPSEATNSQTNNKANVNAANFKLRDDKQIASAMLAFWSIANDQIPPKEVLVSSGISQQRIQAFKNRQTPQSQLNRQTRTDLKAGYNQKTRKSKFEARDKFLSFVSGFQESFPEYARFIPEMLTAWGETRDISGFLSVDSMLLQAKMASVIQVLRNRTERKMKYSESARALGEAKSKWEVATKRYQFTTFEPYDPNLAIVALGPKLEKDGFNLENLSQHDQFALQVLSRVLLRMDNGDIVVSNPLALRSTRHYLTPRLIRYTRQREKRLSKKFRAGSRVTLIRIPKTQPKFLAVVPNWSEQDSLIDNPLVKIKELISSFTSQSIPPQEFIYFNGVL